MSTLVFVDPEISTQADGAQSPRVPVPFPKDTNEAIRQAYLFETETPEAACMVVRVPPAMSPGLSASIAVVAAMSYSMFLADEEEEMRDAEGGGGAGDKGELGF
ncbi:hypothetical protein Tco_0246309 [Tanacetum coccineum]